MSERDQKMTPGPNLSRLPAGLNEENKKETEAMTSVQRNPLEQITCRVGDRSCAGAHAAVISRSKRESKPSGNSLLHLQRNFGNQYVQRVLLLARQSNERGTGTDIENAIQHQRGGGSSNAVKLGPSYTAVGVLV